MSENNSRYTKVIEKIGLYIISLWLLFFFIIVLKIDIPMYFGADWEFIGFSNLIKRNILPCISLFFLGIAYVSYRLLQIKLNGSHRLPVRISNVENINYEHLTFLTTYIIPLICFDLNNLRYTISLGLLLVIIGCIYIKTNLFYANPTLSLLGYQLYKAEGNFSNGRTTSSNIIISRDMLTDDDSVLYIQLDKTTFYARKC